MVTTCLLLRPSAVVGNCKLPPAAFLRYNGYSQHYGAVWSAIEGVMMGTSRYERVFAAIDGRETQEAVARRALQIASLNHANLLFGRVVEAIPTELNAIDFGDLCAAFREKTEEDLEDILSEAKADPNIQNIFWYGYQASGFPIYEGTTCKYYPSGEAWLPDYIAELKKAKHFIFMEYFIIDKGSVWDEILAVLKQKAAEGVEVKVIYDDFGSITLPVNYDKKLKAMGIEAYRFNKVHPAFIIQMNNRDHRKITVIDNNVAFTGGVNLADEYVNRINRFGYWKDSAIRLQGKAVWSMTVMFLGMYTFLTDKNKKIDYLKYKLPCDEVSDGGFYQPYSDTPTDSEAVALNMHLNMVTRARHYVFIDTPYLILTENMIQALIRAAKSGVDVRILTPHHPDKLLVFQITRGNYARLVENGVKIYEYTPGFNHAKNFVSDDSLAIVGSANTDYRSYFLHFENGVLMHNTPEIEKIRDNFLTSLLDARQVTRRDIEKELWIVKIIRAILNIFIPLV